MLLFLGKADADSRTFAQCAVQVDAGIVDNATIAEKAIPGCMLVCQTGKDMKAALGGYLKVLADADASAVGSKLPADDFYYME